MYLGVVINSSKLEAQLHSSPIQCRVFRAVMSREQRSFRIERKRIERKELEDSLIAISVCLYLMRTTKCKSS